MIDIKKQYTRRKDLDSLLTSLVEDDRDVLGEFERYLKKEFNFSNSLLFRDYEVSISTLLESLETKSGEIILSALMPYTIYNIVKSWGFTPVVLDVDLETGLFDISDLNKVVNEKTKFIFNTYTYCVKDNYSELRDFGVPIVDIYLCGLGINKDDREFQFNAEYNIIVLEEFSTINIFGGSILLTDNDVSEIKSIMDLRPNIKLSLLNCSYGINLVKDRNEIISKNIKLVDAFKNSVYKSSYTTLEADDNMFYNLFPVVVKKSLKDIISYCKQNGLQVLRGYQDSIVKNIEHIHAPNSRSLISRIFLVPFSYTMKKDDIELILKILSTLP